MRELLVEEMSLVSGGVRPPNTTTLGTIHVRPPPRVAQTLPYHPPSTGGSRGDGRGGGQIRIGTAGGGPSPEALAGIAKIRDQLGLDLTAYAQMSPTLAQAISTATATYHFNFEWGADSHTKWADQVTGTISINSAAKADILYFLQQVSHELGHVDHRVADRISQTPAEVYVAHVLETEGYATLSNERIQHEIQAAGGGDIHIAGKAGNRAFYDAEYSRWASGQQSYSKAAENIGAYYGQHEDTMGSNYHDHYMSEYRRLGGRE